MTTLLDLFDRQLERSAQRTALRHRSGGMWRPVTWGEWARASSEIAAGLCALGVAPGDRVAIASRTRFEWALADLGVLRAGATTVPIYPELPAEGLRAILADSGARVVFVEDPTQLEALDRSSGIAHAVVFDRVARLSVPDPIGRLDVAVEDVERADCCPVITLDALRAKGKEALAADRELLARRATAIEPSGLACLAYTSGTSGRPKGVPLSHEQFVAETDALVRALPVGVTDEQLLLLPLAHVMGKLTLVLQLRAGYVTSFASSIDEFEADCVAVKPTFVVGVPRLFEKLVQGILERVSKASDAQARIFRWSLAVGREVSALSREGKEPGRVLAFQHRAAGRAIYSRIQQALGGRLRFFLSGAAPLSVGTAETLHALGLLVLEGYGLTEATGASSLNLPHRFRFGTVGMPLPGVDVRIAADGEVLLRGRTIMRGYWSGADEPGIDAEGWLATGDIGHLDGDGFLVITDRKKDIVVTASARNVAPQRIEARLAAHPLISRAVVIGDARPFLVALLVPAEAALRSFVDAEGLGGDSLSLIHHPRVLDRYGRIVEDANADLADYERVRRFALLERDLSADAGELTPSHEVRRKAVAEHYAERIDALYEAGREELADDRFP